MHTFSTLKGRAQEDYSNDQIHRGSALKGTEHYAVSHQKMPYSKEKFEMPATSLSRAATSTVLTNQYLDAKHDMGREPLSYFRPDVAPVCHCKKSKRMNNLLIIVIILAILFLKNK